MAMDSCSKPAVLFPNFVFDTPSLTLLVAIGQAAHVESNFHMMFFGI